MLKAGQSRKGRLEVAALSVEEHPVRFEVASGFADRLQPEDVVHFRPPTSETASLWAQTWMVVKVEPRTEDTRTVFVVEAQWA